MEAKPFWESKMLWFNGIGLLRQLDLTARAPGFSGLFYTNQFGDYVAAPGGPECLAPQICLLQYYNPKYQGIEGRSVVIDFAGRGQVKVPN